MHVCVLDCQWPVDMEAGRNLIGCNDEALVNLVSHHEHGCEQRTAEPITTAAWPALIITSFDTLRLGLQETRSRSGTERGLVEGAHQLWTR